MQARLSALQLLPSTRYTLWCWSSCGKCSACLDGARSLCLYRKLKWQEGFDNLVVTEGLNDLLTKYFKGSAYTATWYVALKDTGAVVAGDTAASHAGWSEITGYTEANRPTLTLGTASGGSIDNSASKASFSINAADLIYGAFCISDNTKSGSSGVLFGGGFFAGGNITNITQANPGVVTTAAAHGLSTGEQVLLSGVGGMTEVNGNTYTANVLSGTTFDIGVDTTGFTAYTSGGLAEKERSVSNGDTLQVQLTITAAAA